MEDDKVNDDVKDKIYDIRKVIEDIKEFPQTYKTILKHEIGNKTLQTILRRKLNRLYKDGIICKTNIPGTRFGSVIFYYHLKKYHILIVGGRVSSEVYCFFEYDQHGRYYLFIKKAWILKHSLWEEVENITVFEGKVLKWI